MTMQKTTTRVIRLRGVDYGIRQPDWFEDKPIDVFINEVYANFSSAQDTLYPRPGEGREDDRHHFISHLKQHGDTGISFLFCSFTPNEMPQSFDQDNLGERNVDLEATDIKDDDGNVRQMVHVCHVLAYGHVVITDSGEGTGGIGALRQYLQTLFRAEIHADFPRLGLTDASGGGLRHEIERNGGVASVQLDLVEPNMLDGSRFGTQMSRARELIAGTRKVRLTSYADREHELSEDNVVEAYNECEANDALDRIKIELHSGETITLRSHRIKRPVTVTVGAGGQPRSDSLRDALLAYLFDLMGADGQESVLTEDGRLRAIVVDAG